MSEEELEAGPESFPYSLTSLGKMLTDPFLTATFCCPLAHIPSDIHIPSMSLYILKLVFFLKTFTGKKEELAAVHFVFSFPSLETCLQNTDV